MIRRRTASAALLLCAALTSVAGAAAPARLDGQSRTSHSWSGSLSGPTVYANAGEGQSYLSPTPEWCTDETCDITDLDLRLPRGRQSGRLVIDLTYSFTASLRMAVYDERGQEIEGRSLCCGSDRIVAATLPAGVYTVIVYDEAGAGGFDVTVTWRANPPHRTSSAGS